jgi:acyl-CoA synthetase (AMP-forming)/AMP-acid ligase II
MELFRNPFFDALQDTDPKKIVFSDAKGNVRAGEISSDALAMAGALQKKGFQQNDRVVLLVPPGKEFLTVFFSIGLLKGTVAIIDPEMGRDNFEAKLRQLKPKWIFVDSRLVLLSEHPILRYLYLKFSKRAFYTSLPKDAQIITTGKKLPLLTRSTHLSHFKKENYFAPQFSEAGNHDLVITYTSGTLAEPKGVVHSVDSLFESLGKIKSLLGTHPATRIGAYLPHFLLIGICSGFPVYLFPKDNSPQWKYSFFNKNKITTLFGPPSDFVPLIRYCKNQNLQFPETITTILLGSAPVYPAFLNELLSVCNEKVNIQCLYGMTENLVVAVADAKTKLHANHRGDYLGSIVSDVAISVTNEGEIFLQSPQLFSRYLHETQRETPHASGDLGYVAEDGTLILTGRKKDMIIRRDTNIYPAIYEKTIRSIPGIHEAALVGNYSDVLHDEEVILFVESDSSDEKLLMAQLKEGKYSIDKEALPDKIVFCKIPRSGRQDKVDRKQLRAMLS